MKISINIKVIIIVCLLCTGCYPIDLRVILINGSGQDVYVTNAKNKRYKLRAGEEVNIKIENLLLYIQDAKKEVFVYTNTWPNLTGSMGREYRCETKITHTVLVKMKLETNMVLYMVHPKKNVIIESDQTNLFFPINGTIVK